ncbi:hypothetical protein PTTG_25953 [Puccinia triticina 1-1 BBBD Race 1]|uniref:Uncharacterized protein n=1 Tax=Puccinia triticina (isolate 1-1 / race 1 (BBBD)) TaxID=630390 RepID=A0A180GY31_PUCT1|nr:hypothetical protein PTTG_25953 [Puccinia triticina 1-1 BBBD Race 1]
MGATDSRLPAETGEIAPILKRRKLSHHERLSSTQPSLSSPPDYYYYINPPQPTPPQPNPHPNPQTVSTISSFQLTTFRPIQNHKNHIPHSLTRAGHPLLFSKWPYPHTIDPQRRTSIYLSIPIHTQREPTRLLHKLSALVFVIVRYPPITALGSGPSHLARHSDSTPPLNPHTTTTTRDRDQVMPGWSRQRSDSKLAAWAKSQDIATVERELERTEKDIRRAGSVSLNPEYVLKRQQERARARDATGRLSSIGLRLDLGPFLFDPHPKPPPPEPEPVPSPKPKQTGSEQREIVHLRAELAKLTAREAELQAALACSERKRDEERLAHERDRKTMLSTIRKLKGEVEDGWSRMIRLKEKYERPNFPQLESGRSAASKIYQTDESFEAVYRPSCPRRVSLEDPADHHHHHHHHHHPQHQAGPSKIARRPASATNHPAGAGRPKTTSILKNPLEGPPRTRRTSFS